MNILVLTSVYPEPDDGNEVVTPTVKYYCEKWVDAGNSVIVIHSNSAFPLLFYWIPQKLREKVSSLMGFNFPVFASRKTLSHVENGVRVYRFPMFKAIPHKRYSKNAINKQVEKIIRTIDDVNFIPDVILSHWLNPQLDILIKLKDLYGVKSSLVFHGDCTAKNIKRFGLLDSVKKIDAVGCRSASYAQFVKSELNLSKTPFVCYSGIPDALADSQLNNLDSISFNFNYEYVYVGRLVKYKNVDVIIHALMETHPRKDFIFHIVGDGAEKENLMNLVNQYGLNDNIVFHGKLSRNDVFKLMSQSYCFIMVSNNETFGMVYIEAMLSGCITIASIDGGVDGVIVNGENGYLSKQGSVDDLTSKLRIINNTSFDELIELRKKAILTAYKYRDSELAKKYLDDVFSW